MKTAVLRVLLLLAAIPCVACAGALNGPSPPAANEPSHSVYLVSHGWHTGIALRRAEVPRHIWPEVDDFPDAEYLEVGWGDSDYYQSRKPGTWLTVKAALWPTSSVLHIVGFSASVESFFPASDIVRIELSARDFEGLCGYLHDSYARDAAGQTIRLGPSLYGEGRFYLAREKFHLFNTCNVWTARGLRTAGVPVTPFFSLTTEQLMSQVRKFGTHLPAPVPDAK